MLFKMTTRRVAVKIAYMGKDFFGSQRQPDRKTVVGEVISNLLQISGDKTEGWFDIKPASRTDRDVNALGNVIVFNTTFDDDTNLLKALNAVSKGVYYRSITTVEKDFNPRFASERIYRYVLPAKSIDELTARGCAELFIGEHDFIRFCRPDERPTTLKIDSVELRKEKEVIIIEFRARYFLWNMIRKLCAAIASVGSGRSRISDVERALNGENVSFGLTRPDALTLMDIIYDGLEFTVPSDDMFDECVEEEMFNDLLRTFFFKSL